MKDIIVILIGSIAFNSALFSQNYVDSILNEIEKNNTTLSALQKRADADKIGNKTGIYLQNPEATLNYLLGNPTAIGNRTDFSITQSFDFPTAYGYKSQISKIKNEQVELEYQKQRKELLLKARLICYELIYFNALKAELSKRLVHAKSIASSYKSKFDVGQTNMLEFNKARLNLLNLHQVMESLSIERAALLGELARLNGGLALDFTESEFPETNLPSDFEQWYVLAEQSNPLLNWLKKEIELSRKQVRLNKALSLPRLKTGYMGESAPGQEFRGVTVGLSIPLWENKNTIKYTKANAMAIENITIDNKVQVYNHLKNLHTKAIGLQNSCADYKSGLQTIDNSGLLKKALDKGEITLINYMLELAIYYESLNKLLELEREKNKIIAALNQYL